MCLSSLRPPQHTHIPHPHPQFLHTYARARTRTCSQTHTHPPSGTSTHTCPKPHTKSHKCTCALSLPPTPCRMTLRTSLAGWMQNGLALVMAGAGLGRGTGLR